MKRIISLCCIVLVLLLSMPQPVRADDLQFFTNFLDYNYVGDQSNQVTITSSNFTLDIPAPFANDWSYCDIVLYSNHSFTVSNYQNQLTVLSLGNNVYRVYGNLVGYNQSFLRLTFNFPSGYWYLYFYSVNCSSTSFRSEQAGFEATGFYPGGNINLSKFWGDNRPTKIQITNSNYDDRGYVLYLSPQNWKKYDYLEFQVYFINATIDSISCVMGNEVVPLEVSYIYPSNTDTSYYVTFSLDLRQLNRSIDDYPMVMVMGNVKYDGVTQISLFNSVGYTFSDPPSALLYFFDKMRKWISDQTASINSFFTQQTNSIRSFFSDLNSWIDTQTNSIGDYMRNHFINLSQWIQAQTNTLESAIRGDTASGDDFQQEVDQKDQELDEMAAVMDSVTKPAIDKIDVSVDDYVSQADIQVLATPMAVFFEGEIFSKIIIMSILLATVSYVLYGKR